MDRRGPTDSDKMNDEHSNHTAKRAAAEAAAAQIEDGMIVGLGTGSTAAFAIEALGRRVREGLAVTGIPTSEEAARLAAGLGIPVARLDSVRIDLTIDGADEVDAVTLNLIKGRGGALLREKIVARASDRVIIIVDESKLVGQLGADTLLPVEVIPFGWEATQAYLRRHAISTILRRDPAGEPFLTDSGHYILDCDFGPIPKPSTLEVSLDAVTGVVEHGLFLGLATEVIVGGADGARTLPGR